MPRLIVTDGPNRGAVHPVLPDRNRVGRDPASEVVLLDEGVSRLHAELVLDLADGRLRLEDRGSRNGTFLNGVRCARADLEAGDELRLAGVTLVVVGDDDGSGSGVAPCVSTMTLSLDDGDAAGGAAPARRAAVAVPRSPTYLLGDSDPMRRVQEQIATAAPAGAAVLLTGESGTGKELAAAAIHRLSPRRRGPFVAINGAALRGDLLESELFGHEKGAFTGAVARRKGAFELATGGTLFLDEVGELPGPTQATLLRAIEGKGFRRLGGGPELRPDVRVVTATNRDLLALSAEGAFRADLYYRLAVVEIRLPPLRERGDDVTLLAERFLADLRRETGHRLEGFSAEARRALLAHRWPGNVRELRNAVERAAIFCRSPEVEPDDLPPAVAAALDAPVGELAPRDGDDDGGEGGMRSLQEVERAHIEAVLRHAGGNKSRAARILGIDRVTLYARIKRWGIET